MSVQQTVLPIVVFLLMVAIGMELRPRDFRALALSPRIPVIGSLIHTLTFPIVAVSLILLVRMIGVPMSEAVLIGMLLIAACPSGGFSNVLTMIAGGDLALSVTLTAISSLASFATVPLLMGAFAGLVSGLDAPVRLPVVETLMQLFLLVLVPIGVGMGSRAWQETWVSARVKQFQNWGQVLLYITVALIIWENFDTVSRGLREAMPWSLGLCALNLSLCYGLARACRFTPEDSITVAFEGCIRNLAIAFLVAVTVMDRMDIAVLPTVYFVAVLLVAIAVAKTWRRLLGHPG